MVDKPPVLLIAGLGNPGRRYNRTWHNLGYMALDYWAEKKGLTFKPGRGEYAMLEYYSKQGVVTFLKPTSFMNLSGIPIGEVLRYRKLSPENLLIICDDIALPFGTLRIRISGSSGGHNGIASVIGQTGTLSFPRLRMGIFLEGWRGSLSDYVLSKVPEDCMDDLGKVLAFTTEAIDCIIQEGANPAMNRFNGHFLDDSNTNKQQ